MDFVSLTLFVRTPVSVTVKRECVCSPHKFPLTGGCSEGLDFSLNTQILDVVANPALEYKEVLRSTGRSYMLYHGDDPLLKPTGIQIAIKCLPGNHPRTSRTSSFRQEDVLSLQPMITSKSVLTFFPTVWDAQKV